MEQDNFALPVEKEVTTTEPFIQEEFPQVDPLQVEQELIGQFKEMQDNMPVQDVATHFFRMYFPIFKQLLSGLSNKDARRVAEHVVQWPLEEKEPKFNDKKAEQAFQVGVRLMDSKFIMRAYVEMEMHKKLLADKEKKAQEELEAKQASEQPSITEEPVVEQTQGETNG